ncbi:MAG: NAD-dependent epimerase/dehydratase family protein [Methanomassiliicoccales archaeon]|nr:NAD-dependent epimerase/dehydratase family protein [Methanomassiliicoccales archaeon]
MVITGSSGQVGSYLLEHFSDGHEVLGLDVRPSPIRPAGGASEMVDIAKTADLGKYIKGADWVIHCAAQVSVEKSLKDPIFDAQNNVIGTVNLLWNAFKHDARNILYVSSAAVYGNPIRVPLSEDHPTNPMSPYGASKLCGEKYAMAFSSSYGIGVSIIRPFNIYSARADPSSPYSGVITRFVKWAKEGKPLLIDGDGKQTRDFVHMNDVVQMVDLVVRKPNISLGRILNCGTGKKTSVLELAESVLSVSGGKSRIEHVAPRVGDIRDSCADIGSGKELLGYAPRVPLREGLKDVLG